MDYARIRATAARLLEGAAQGSVMLSRETPGTTTPGEPWVPTQPAHSLELLSAVVKGISAQFVDGSTVLASDREVIFAPPAMGVEAGDGMSIDGKDVAVLRVTAIPGAGEPAAYRAIVRG